MIHGTPIGRIVTNDCGEGGFLVVFRSGGAWKPTTVFEIVRDAVDGDLKVVELGPSCIPLRLDHAEEDQSREVCWGNGMVRVFSSGPERCLTRAEFGNVGPEAK